MTTTPGITYVYEPTWTIPEGIAVQAQIMARLGFAAIGRGFILVIDSMPDEPEGYDIDYMPADAAPDMPTTDSGAYLGDRDALIAALATYDPATEFVAMVAIVAGNTSALAQANGYDVPGMSAAGYTQVARYPLLAINDLHPDFDAA